MKWNRYSVHPSDGWFTVVGSTMVVVMPAEGRWDAYIERQKVATGRTREEAAQKALAQTKGEA